MKLSIAQLISLPIAATVSLGYLQPIQAQTATNVGLRHSNVTLEQCLDDTTRNKSVQIIICNLTSGDLTLVGNYKSFGEKWPMGNVPSQNAQYRDFDGRDNFFKFGANYVIGDTGLYFQIAVAKDPVGRKRINVCNVQEGGDGPAERCTESMTSMEPTPVNLRNLRNLASVRAVFREVGKTQWVFFVRQF
jgi:hypothetical protein